MTKQKATVPANGGWRPSPRAGRFCRIEGGKQCCFLIPPEDHDAIKQYAAKTGLTFSEAVRTIITWGLEELPAVQVK